MSWLYSWTQLGCNNFIPRETQVIGNEKSVGALDTTRLFPWTFKALWTGYKLWKHTTCAIHTLFSLPLIGSHFNSRMSQLGLVVVVTLLFSAQLELVQSIVAEVNKKTGEAECQFYRRGLTYLEESQRLPEIRQSRFLFCHGELKNNKGQVSSSSNLPLTDL